MASPVVHFEILGKDGAKTREFYGSLFDWKYNIHEGMDYGLVEAAGEKSIGGGIGGAPEGVKPVLTFYVQVDDLQAYLDKAEKLGGKTISPPAPIPGVGSFAWFADPDGNCVGLYKPE